MSKRTGRLVCAAVGAGVAAGVDEIWAGMVDASVAYTQMIAIDLKKIERFKKIDRFKKLGPGTVTMR
jgi:hypothetical protein